MMKLYDNPSSTCSQKVRLALAEKSIQYDQHTIDWSKWEHLSDWYLALNPNGVVPTLVHGSDAIVDSSVICEYLDEVFLEPRLSPDDPVGRARMRAWMRFLEEVPTVAIRAPSYNAHWVGSLRNEQDRELYEQMVARMPLRRSFYRKMTEEGFPSEMIAESESALRMALERLSDGVGHTGRFVIGAELSLADIGLLPTLVRMEDIGMAHLWDDLPRVQEWYERMQQRPSFDAVFTTGARLDARVEKRR